MKMMTKFSILLICISIVHIAVRLYRIDAAVADWHSWRQADTLAVAQIYVKDGIDLLHPRYYDMSNIQSGFDNPEGWRMVEFPLYQAIGAQVVRVIPLLDIMIVLRVITIISSVLSAVFLALFVRQYYGDAVALLSAFLYAVLPYSIYYGRTILPETFMVFWALLSLFLINRSSIGSILAASIALLVKPTAVFLLIPAVFLIPKTVRSVAAWILCPIPLLWWRMHIASYPEGIPVYGWLLNKDNIRFKGAWFYWLFAERIGRLMLGYWGAGFILTGFASVKKNAWIAWSMAAGVLLYFVVFAAGNVQHDYYQIPAIPAVSLISAIGFYELFRKSFSGKIISIAALLFSISFSWYTMRTYYWINRPEIVEAGMKADELLPPQAKVIAPYNGDTTFLTLTKRSGWPLGFDIGKKLAMGASAYVSVGNQETDTEIADLAATYTTLIRTPSYIIIDLTKPISL